jgi:hypothetical protein
MLAVGVTCGTAAVQGMSDLAAPLLAVLQDEADGFWCFAALMERLQANFDTDCSCALVLSAVSA